MGLVSYQVNGIMEHVPFQAKECDIRNSPRLGDEVEFDLAQIKRTKEHVALNMRIIQRAHANNMKNVGGGVAAPNTAADGLSSQHSVSNGDSAKVYKGFIASLKDTFGFIETDAHDKEIFFHYRYTNIKTESFGLNY